MAVSGLNSSDLASKNGNLAMTNDDLIMKNGGFKIKW